MIGQSSSSWIRSVFVLKVVGSDGDGSKVLADDDNAFSPQADEGITIEPLTNSTDEEYDEYYDIWEGKLFDGINIWNQYLESIFGINIWNQYLGR